MKLPMLFRFDLAFATRILAAGLCVLLSGTATRAIGRDAGPMRLELKTGAPRYLVAEPISFRFVLHNLVRPTDDAITLSRKLRLEYRHESDPKFWIWAAPYMLNMWGYSQTTSPGEAVSVERSVVYDEDKNYTHEGLLRENRSVFALTDLPGKYYFKAIYRSDDPKNRFQVESEIVEVEVVKPEGIDAEANKLWMNNELLYTVDDPVLGMPSGLEAGQQKLKEFLAAYPKSTYSAFASEALRRFEQARNGKRDTGPGGTVTESAREVTPPTKADKLNRPDQPIDAAKAGSETGSMLFGKGALGWLGIAVAAGTILCLALWFWRRS